MSGNKIRTSRGKLIGQNGPGSLYVDTEGVSYLVSAVDKWYADYDETTNEFDINDVRLESFLGVDGFREVPLYREKNSHNKAPNTDIVIPLQRFPLLHYCSKCQTLKTLLPTYSNANVTCNKCDSKQNHIQFPIVIACKKGHIQDFPFFMYTHSQTGYDNDVEHRVWIEKRGSSILNWNLKCICGASHSLSGITGKSKDDNGPTSFQREFSFAKCDGHKGWCGKDVKDEECDENPQAILKNSINVYNPETFSALSIANISNKKNRDLQSILNEEFDRLTNYEQNNDGDNLIVEESFKGNRDTIIKEVYYIKSLQELVVQTGFHRLEASDDIESVAKALDKELETLIFSPDNKEITWYPAKKMFGEGIFIEFTPDILDEWASHPVVSNQYKELSDRTDNFYLRERFNSPISVMLHTFSHALLRELGNLAGYPLVALKEKLYFLNGRYGILIYVTDSDKEGTFGGLVRLANETDFRRVLERARKSLDWCSSDPVCTEIGTQFGQGVNNSNGAACHNCIYVPATTCSHRNCFLDRSLLNDFTSGSSISKKYNWLPMEENYKIDIKRGTAFSYNSWEEAKAFEDNPYYSDNNYPLPELLGGTLKVNKIEYEIKYLWEKKKLIHLYRDQIIGFTRIQVEGWTIEIEADD